MIDGYVLEQTDCTKFLGVFIDSKLNWSNHINHISLKISKGLGIICRFRNVMPHHILLALYYTLIYPYLNYCNIIWGCAKASILHKLIILQKRAVRIITSSPYLSESSPLFRRLRLIKITDIHKLQVALFMHKIKFQLLPVSCLQYFKLNTHRVYATRQKYYFDIATFRINIRERSIAINGPRLWHSLSNNLQDCTSLNTLKRLIVESFLNVY